MKYTEQDYINKCNELDIEYVGNRKDKNRGTMIDFICKIHRDKGVQSSDWSHFRTYKYGCRYCSGRGETNEDIIPLIKNKDVELISDYTGNEKPINCRCKKCGNEWTTLPKVLMTNGAGCPICGRKKANANESKPHEQFVKELQEINPDIEVIGIYAGTHRKVKCRCKVDGTVWDAYPANLLNRSAGCPTCNISNGEREMVFILKKLKINYVQQYSIEDCVYKRKLKFDAFDIDNNIAFEYNGEQHYRPVDFAHNGEEWANNQFELTKNRDRAKMEYCNNNNIPMVIIPYWERSNMESFIVSKLNEITNQFKN